ncbi:MAG: metallophosphoesterase [Eubacteriales bacterium]
MNLNKLKKVGAITLALAMMAPSAIQALADTADEGATVSNEFVSSTVVDADKEPKQLNVHVGDDAASQVNVTYTTVADTRTVIAVTKADGTGGTMYFEGISYLGLGGKYIHEITVSGLEPYTQYNYTVGDGFNSYDGSFKTALAQGDTTPFTFVYLADTQVSNATNAKALGATLAAVNEMDPDFVYLAGDQTDTNNNESQWEWFFNNDGLFPTGGEDLFANHTIAITQGNHDNDEMYQHINAPAEAGNIVYSFDYGVAKFIILNLEAARYSNDARDQQEAYLRAEVADAKANGQWVIVGFHKSLYTGASHIVDSDVVAARKFWCPIFAELDVDLVLQGHDHVYSRGFVTAEGENANAVQDENGVYTQPDNAPLYMVGGHAGGLKWYSQINYTVSAGDPLALNYSFLDVDSAAGDNGSDVLKEQVITTLEVTNEKISVVNYCFKYDTTTDTITTEMYVYDSFSVQRDLEENATSFVDGDELVIVEEDNTVEYTVSFSNTIDANAFQTALTYDETVLELVSVESDIENPLFTSLSDENGVADFIVGLNTSIDAQEKTAIVKYIFKLKEGVDADEVTVTLTKADTVYVAENKDIVSNILKKEATTILYSYERASDINKDGKVTLADLSYALGYYQTAEAICDINLDGVVDTTDFAIISDYIRK